MNFSIFMRGCTLIAFLVSMALAEPPKKEPKAVTIPLDKIRQGSSGSRQLRDLEPEFFVYRDTPEKIAKYSTPEGLKEIERVKQRAAEESLVFAIERAMGSLPAGKSAQASAGFIVPGFDRAAIQGVYDVLVKGERPRDGFPSGSDLSAVFFSLPMQPAVRLDRVEQRPNVIEIRYTLISHGRLSNRWNLALIPLGKLPPGEYRVDIIRSAEKEPRRDSFPLAKPGLEKTFICRPFRFAVIQQP